MCMVHSNKLTKELIEKVIKAKKPLKMCQSPLNKFRGLSCET